MCTTGEKTRTNKRGAGIPARTFMLVYQERGLGQAGQAAKSSHKQAISRNIWRNRSRGIYPGEINMYAEDCSDKSAKGAGARCTGDSMREKALAQAGSPRGVAGPVIRSSITHLFHMRGEVTNETRANEQEQGHDNQCCKKRRSKPAKLLHRPQWTHRKGSSPRAQAS